MCKFITICFVLCGCNIEVATENEYIPVDSSNSGPEKPSEGASAGPKEIPCTQKIRLSQDDFIIFGCEERDQFKPHPEDVMEPISTPSSK